jgi:hypothetical protein
MIDSQRDIFVEPSRSLGSKLLAGAAALVITALVFAGYALLRKRHAQDSAALLSQSAGPAAAARRTPLALITIDDAMLRGNKTVIGGVVRNTSTEKMEDLAVEIELKRRADGVTETQLVGLQPAQLEPQQEGRYSLQLQARDYGSARLVALKAGSNKTAVPYATAQGQKRPAERLESKTVVIDKPAGKGGEFLNSPDNPARVP